MKPNLKIMAALLLTIALFSFTAKKEIGKCFLSFSNPSNLTATAPDRLPENSEKVRPLTTENGDVPFTCLDGYRILYNNDKGASFVNLKVELSDPKSYESDQKLLLENLRYLNSNTDSMETADLIELEFNGYKITGLSRSTIESGSTLGIFIMFPGNDVVVYFYFNNLKPKFRHYSSIGDYKKLRNKFMDEYTRHLMLCKE